MGRQITAWTIFALLVMNLALPASAGALPAPDIDGSPVSLAPSTSIPPASAVPGTDALPASPAPGTDTPPETPVPGPDVPPELPAIFVIDNGGFARSTASVIAELQLESGSEVRAYVYDAHVPPDTPVATGMFFEWTTDDGTPARREQIVVRGDVTGTGKAGIGQVVRIARALTGKEPLDGIWLTAGDLDGTGQIDLSDLVQAAAELQAVADEADGALAEAIVPMYFETPNQSAALPLYFTGDARDIPYISVSTLQRILSRIFRTLWNDMPLVLEVRDSTATLYRGNGADPVIDAAAGTIMFPDRNAFFAPLGAGTVLDIVSRMPLLPDGAPRYIERAPGSFGRNGHEVTVNLSDYGIAVAQHGPQIYLPLQTVSDVFLTPLGCCAAYNGRFIGIASLREHGALLDMYYAAPAGKRSAELAAFSYNEFCLAMDMYYGLQKQQNIAGFDALLRQTNLYGALHSPDAVLADSALQTLARGYLGDVHTQLMAPSFYAGKDADIKTYASSIALDRYRTAYARATESRTRAFHHGVPAYQEIADTAFVTLDGFVFDPTRDYYAEAPSAEAGDTVGIVAYAHQQITRPGSPVRTVVLDLSCSTGGDLDAAVYALGWLLGTATLNLNDTKTGAQSSVRYRSDVNLDGAYSAQDAVSDLNCVCLVSPASFSAANLAATVLKGTKVQIVGQRTGGGSCGVLPVSLADGSVMRISGPISVSALENGSYYDTDRGVEPDFRLNTYAEFYDRDTLAGTLREIFAVQVKGQPNEE